ncbi:MAG: thiamine pyrophosphate-dependent enzyme [Pseudomonadota bacterium]|nr:thiamine pyrophosphate-binding protein [Alphaproteobacteria bacterium]MEC8531298.1 thiamine pyrophosphate-dependent enzyme [Pseudomonadota bacterium]MEC8724803.1 thiamine pyrophosphate-dependent enzyme [Pseudomonadota bacterium]
MKNYIDGGEAILEAFRQLDIDYVIASPGSEWGSVWEAFARQEREKTEGPRYLNCAHETLAVDLAIGYSVMTGRMQAVMLHTGVGLLQGSIGIDTAYRQSVPMVVVSGESLSYSEHDGFDPGPQWHGVLSVVGGPTVLASGITKWSQSVSSQHTLYEQLIRAGEMAQRSPAGPVYMSVPIETMLHDWTPPQAPRAVPPAPKPVPPAEDIEAVADMLLNAKNPAIVAESIGRDPAGYSATVELSEMLAIPVSECRWLDFTNFPKEHPMYQGMGEPDYLKDCDVVLTLRARAPWTPPSAKPANAKIVNIDETPFRPHMVHQSLQADIFLEGDAIATLQSLNSIICDRVVDAEVSQRWEKWSEAHNDMVARNKAIEADGLAKETITPIGLCATLSALLPDDAVFVDETITHRPIIIRHLDYRGPRSFYTAATGGLGQGLGLALGTKLARPDCFVVSVIGDGSFMYNPVVQSLTLSKHEELPIFVVIFNNMGYSAMRKEHHSYYPNGLAANNSTSVGHTITDMDYAELARAFGFYGRKVDRLIELENAIQEGQRAVCNGQTAILNVVLDEGDNSI